MLNLNKIKNIASEKGMSISELAQKLGMSEQSLYEKIRKNIIRTDTLTKIAEALEINEAKLFISNYSDEKIEIIAGEKDNKYGDANVWKRIGIIQAHQDTDQKGFCEMLKISPQTLSAMMSRKTEPGFKFIKAIYRLIPNINIHWFLFGEGSMFIDEKNVGKCKHCEDLRKNNAVHIRYIENLEKNLMECKKQMAKFSKSEIKKGKVG